MTIRTTPQIRQVFEAVLADDQAQRTPVIQFVSDSFWERMAVWAASSHIPSPLLIGLAGGSGSGKSLIRKTLVHLLEPITTVSAFTQDNYYRNFAVDFPDWSEAVFYDRINFDDPQHLQLTQMAHDLQHLKTMRPGQVLSIPKLIYGTPDHKPTSLPQGLAVPVALVMITEGIHAFQTSALREAYDIKLFVDVDEPNRRTRWLLRNQRDNRGTTDNMWDTTVQCLQTHILPKRSYADIILNNSAPKAQVVQLLQALIQGLAQFAVQAA